MHQPPAQRYWELQKQQHIDVRPGEAGEGWRGGERGGTITKLTVDEGELTRADQLLHQRLHLVILVGPPAAHTMRVRNGEEGVRGSTTASAGAGPARHEDPYSPLEECLLDVHELHGQRGGCVREWEQ